MPMIANIEIPKQPVPNALQVLGRFNPQWTSSPEKRDSSRRAGRHLFPANCRSDAALRPVEGFSTFVPFSIFLRATTFVGEQFWGRAARAFLTRKSRDARFIFSNHFFLF
jgi:hypothetical protein